MPTEPRGGWRATIIEQRSEIERVIEDSPSLRQTVGAVAYTDGLIIDDCPSEEL